VKNTSSSGHVARVEALVNEKLAEAGAAISGGDSQIVVILAMMNLAEALLAAKSECEAERRGCKERLTGLLDRLDWQVG